jgi:hypothetical protein
MKASGTSALHKATVRNCDRPRQVCVVNTVNGVHGLATGDVISSGAQIIGTYWPTFVITPVSLMNRSFDRYLEVRKAILAWHLSHQAING